MLQGTQHGVICLPRLCDECAKLVSARFSEAIEEAELEKTVLDAVRVWGLLRLGLPDTAAALEKHINEVLAPAARLYQQKQREPVPGPPKTHYERGRAQAAGEMLGEWCMTVAFGLSMAEIDEALRKKAADFGYVHPALREKAS